MPRDYYDILGVSRSADAAAIRKAFRKLARKYHPDVDASDDAKKRFQEVQEAYDVLSDPEKRKRYDQFGHAAFGGGGGGAGTNADPFSGFGRASSNAGPGGFSFRTDQSGEEVDLSGIFEQLFGQRGRGGGRTGQAGGGFGGQGFGGFGPFGSTGTGGRSSPGQAPVPGDNLRHTITIPFDVAVQGGSYTVQLQSGSQTQTIDVKIPRGINPGAKLRVRGKGQPSPTGGKPGDLILTVNVADHPYFRREGLDLYIEVPVSISEAAFGAKVDVPTLDGKATLSVPPGSSGGRKLRLRGAGIQNTKGDKGDLYAILRLHIPEKLTDKQRQLLEELAGSLPDPRAQVPWQ
jgi:DnaJ-class molecular chaperone